MSDTHQDVVPVARRGGERFRAFVLGTFSVSLVWVLWEYIGRQEGTAIAAVAPPPSIFLAALYESWSIPLAVLLVIPLGLIGAVFAVNLRGLENDVYLQIGLLTTMGLAAKNAILMIEFAEQEERKGKRVIEAAVEAARIRLRPILMTSFAFIFGVLPLAISTGAGAGARHSAGTGVMGGMIAATFLAIFFVPMFFKLITDRHLREKRSTDEIRAEVEEAHRASEGEGNA